MKPTFTFALFLAATGLLSAASITYTSPNVPVNIPDNSTVTSTLTVPDSYLITSLTAQINITHTWTGDLAIALIAPDATRVALVTNRGGSADNFSDTIFSDAAATPIDSGAAPFAGTFRPEQPLSNFNGINISGLWTLEITDRAEDDFGTLLGWSITAEGGAAIPEPASLGLFALGLGGLLLRKHLQ